MAILCMVVLHLFCREGNDVFGTPLLWIDHDTPFVYWFGFYAEICVSIYSICMGYAQYMLYKRGKANWAMTRKRIFKLLINYWIILVMFSLAGLIYNTQNSIPGSLSDFLKSIVLLHSYNGAWWFLNTYIIFLLIPPAVKFLPVEKLSVIKGLICCFIFELIWYLINKFGLWITVSSDYAIAAFILKEVNNLIKILPAVYIGAFFCKGNLIPRISESFSSKFKNKKTGKYVLGLIWLVLFVGVNVIHKAVITIVSAFITFVLFNIWEKGMLAEKVFIFLGKHSTNMWLTHMFFYAVLFKGLVQSAKYPLIILLFMIVLCVVSSYIEMAAEIIVNRLLAANQQK